MGLDMYLNIKYFIWDDKNRIAIGKAIDKTLKKDIGLIPTNITFTGITWRKANQIHNWFVENVQNDEDDCGSYYVSIEDLKRLHKAVCDVLKDNSKAKELLPTGSGFFFGSTDYDEWYFKDLEHTKEELERLFDHKYIGDFEFEYQSSW